MSRFLFVADYMNCFVVIVLMRSIIQSPYYTVFDIIVNITKALSVYFAINKLLIITPEFRYFLPLPVFFGTLSFEVYNLFYKIYMNFI